MLRQTDDIDLILETQTFFTFRPSPLFAFSLYVSIYQLTLIRLLHNTENKSTNILLKGASGAYIHSPSHTGGIVRCLPLPFFVSLFSSPTVLTVPFFFLTDRMVKARSGGSETRTIAISILAP
jgi:hypothetical protein